MEICTNTTPLILLSASLVRAGNSIQRLDSCTTYAIPPSFAQYLNTSFLGDRQFIDVGPVNYTYYQFGPLEAGATGVLAKLTVAEHVSA